MPRTRHIGIRRFDAAEILFVNPIKVTDEPSANGSHFSYLHVFVFLYDPELGCTVENSGNTKYSES